MSDVFEAQEVQPARLKISYSAMENGFKRDLRNYPLYFLLWTVLGLFYFSQGLTQRLVWHDPTPWWHYLLAWLSGVYIWALLTPVMLWLGRQFPVEHRNWFPRIALHLLLSAGFSAFELSLESALEREDTLVAAAGFEPAVLPRRMRQ